MVRPIEGDAPVYLSCGTCGSKLVWREKNGIHVTNSFFSQMSTAFFGSLKLNCFICGSSVDPFSLRVKGKTIEVRVLEPISASDCEAPEKEE